MKSTKFNWIPGVLAVVILAAVLLGTAAYVKSQRDFEVIHNPETPTTRPMDAGKLPA